MVILLNKHNDKAPPQWLHIACACPSSSKTEMQNKAKYTIEKLICKFGLQPKKNRYRVGSNERDQRNQPFFCFFLH
jgi:hypothetical protein